eukprot:g40415.t1
MESGKEENRQGKGLKEKDKGKEAVEGSIENRSRRCGQYSMNQAHSRNMENPQYERSYSQDSLDELSMADYWNEVENIQTTQENCQEEQEEVAVKVPD